MKQKWSHSELEHSWTLLPDELLLLESKKQKTKLNFAFQLKYFELYGQFWESKVSIPRNTLRYMAKQLNITSSQSIFFSPRTLRAHKKEILEFHGFRRFESSDKSLLENYLIEKIIPEGRHDLVYLKEKGYEFLKSLKIQSLTGQAHEKLIYSSLKKHEKDLFFEISKTLTLKQMKLFDVLIDDQKNPESFSLYDLKDTFGKANLKSIQKRLKKLTYLESLNLSSEIFKTLSSPLLEKIHCQVMTLRPVDLRNFNSSKRYALLCIFCYRQSQIIKDDLLEIFLKLIERPLKNAENRVQKTFLSQLKKITGKTNLLFKLSKAALSNPKGSVEEVIFPVVSEEVLSEVVKESKLTKGYQETVHEEMRSSYLFHYRRMLQPLLDVLTFQSNNKSHSPLIKALQVIKDHLKSSLHFYPSSLCVPVEGVIPSSLHNFFVDEKQRVNRISYEILTLLTLKNKLKCREIWIEGALRYRNPDEDLPENFNEARKDYYKLLAQPMNEENFIQPLQKKLQYSLELLNRNIPKNKDVRLISKKKRGWIKLSPLKEKPLPKNIEALKEDVAKEWSMISLLDVLKETDLRTHFTSTFTIPLHREHMDREDLQIKLILALYAYGSNTGLKRVSSGQTGVSYEELRYIQRRYLNSATIRQAIVCVVNDLLKIRESLYWGEDNTSCACDSKHFGAWDQNLMTEWHIRYRKPGIMIYWHVDKKSACIYSQIKTCPSSEVAAMIQGVLHHCTEAKVSKSYVDSHGQSLVGFAFSHLLGFDLLPRLKAIYKQKLSLAFSTDRKKYPHLSLVLTDPIKWHQIRQQYDEMIKFTIALKLKTADASTILRRFTRHNVQHPTYKALLELGKVLETIFLCQYLSSKALRQEIHDALNVVERWNGVNDFVFYGKSGEFRSNKKEEQELSMLCLHLLQMSLVYINTLMIQSVLKSAKWQNKLTERDKAALTPLIYRHINPYGIFLLDMKKRIKIPERGVKINA